MDGLTKEEQQSIAESMQKSDHYFDRALGEFIAKISVGDAMLIKKTYGNTWDKYSKFSPKIPLADLHDIVRRLESLERQMLHSHSQ